MYAVGKENLNTVSSITRSTLDNISEQVNLGFFSCKVMSHYIERVRVSQICKSDTIRIYQ